MTTFPPTPEQQVAIDVFATGLHLALDAGAGCGKTTVMRMLGESAPHRRGQYLAFNAAIVAEAKRKMPRNVEARTVHSLAMRAVGHRYRKRLDGGRLRSDEIALRLGIAPYVVHYGAQRKVVQRSTLAGHVMKAIGRFCHSGDDEPGRKHLAYIDGIDLPKPDGTRTWENNDAIRDLLEPALARAWADLTDPDGNLGFRHDHYLKNWALSRPRLDVDFVLVDEAQDLDELMLGIVEGQRDHAQLCYVGDAQQSIYGFRESVNAMELSQVDARATLSRSFRFGQPIADVANWCLGHLAASLRLTGDPGMASSVRPLAEPRAVLCRTNAGAFEVLFDEMRRGRRPALLGSGKDVAMFARGAKELQEQGHTGHPELECFDSWPQVLEYVEADPQGDELALMVSLVETYGPDVILETLDRQPHEDLADVVVSTAHRAKGKEWASVQVHADFKAPDPMRGNVREEWRLLYVAATRAQEALDVTPCPAFAELLAPPRQPRPAPIPLPPAAHERPVVEPDPEPAVVPSASAQAMLDLLR